jgi:hypothetical protein
MIFSGLDPIAATQTALTNATADSTSGPFASITTGSVSFLSKNK